jgi:hypothetical protein
MARGPATFKQQDLTRALKGVTAAGIEVAHIRITKDGNIEIDTGKPPENEAGNEEIKL